MVDCLLSVRTRRPEVDGLFGQGLSGETDGLDRLRGRPTPKVANSTTAGTGAGAISVDGALVNRIGLIVVMVLAELVVISSTLREAGPAINPPLPKGLVLLPSGLGGILVALKIGHRLWSGDVLQLAVVNCLGELGNDP